MQVKNWIEEIRILTWHLPRTDMGPQEGERNIIIRNGEICPIHQSISAEARMRTLDEMLEKTTEIVQNLLVIPELKVRVMPVVRITPYEFDATGNPTNRFCVSTYMRLIAPKGE